MLNETDFIFNTHFAIPNLAVLSYIHYYVSGKSSVNYLHHTSFFRFFMEGGGGWGGEEVATILFLVYDKAIISLNSIHITYYSLVHS